jgi:hypothetical protein
MVISYTDNRVLCLYADDQRVAETLLVHHLKRSNAKNVRVNGKSIGKKQPKPKKE